MNFLPYNNLPPNNVSDDDAEDSVTTSHDGEDVRKVSTKKMSRPRFSFLPNEFTFRTSSASAALKRSREIDKQLSIEKPDQKILILGACQTGKSALLNSMKISYNHENAFDYDDRQRFKEVIFIK